MPSSADEHYQNSVRAFAAGQYAEAVRESRRALGGYARHPPLVRARTLTQLGISLDGLGELDRARTALSRAVSMCSGLADATEDHAIALVNLGGVLRKLGEPDEARRAFERARDEFDMTRTPRSYAVCCFNLGALSIDLREYGAALRALDDAARTYGRLELGTEVARCRKRKGIAFLRLGRFEDAEMEFTSALEGFDADPDTGREAADCLNDLASLEITRGRYDEALERLDEAAIRYAQWPQTEYERAMCGMNRGLAHLMAGRRDDAVAPLDEAVELFERMPGAHLDLIDALSNRAALRQARGDDTAAGEDLREAIAVARQSGASGANLTGLDVRLGVLAERLGRSDEAIDILLGALDHLTVGRDAQVIEAAVLLPLGHALGRLGLNSEAERVSALARTWFVDRDDRHGAAHALEQLAHLHAQRGNNELAERELVTAVAELERIGASDSDLFGCRVRLAALRFGSGRFAEAIDALGRERSLADFLLSDVERLPRRQAAALLSSIAQGGRPELAEDRLSELVADERTPTDLAASCWVNLGTIFLISEPPRPASALQAFERARDLRPAGHDRLADQAIDLSQARAYELHAGSESGTRREALLRRGLALALPVLLQMEEDRLAQPSIGRRAEIAHRIDASALALVFRLATAVDDGTLIADLTAIFRSSGVAASSEMSAQRGLDAYGTMLVDELLAGESPVIRGGGETSATIEALLPLIGLGEAARRRQSPALMMPDGRLALSGHLQDPGVGRVRFV